MSHAANDRIIDAQNDFAGEFGVDPQTLLDQLNQSFPPKDEQKKLIKQK